MTRPKEQWVVILTTQDGAYFCRRCGQSYTLALPAPISVVIAASKAFEKDHRRCRPNPQGDVCHFCKKRGHAPLDCEKLRPMTPEEWLHGPDTGTSSRAIWAVMNGRPHMHLGGFGGESGAAPPADPDDFGRCYRLLRAFPDWRGRLGEVAARYPSWARMVEAWDELTALYEEELAAATGSAPKLYARMQELRRVNPPRRAAEGGT